MSELKIFSVATSGNGTLGLITGINDSIPDAVIYTGIILEDNTFEKNGQMITSKKGDFWFADKPTFVAQVSPEKLFNCVSQDQQHAWTRISVENDKRAENS
jgi:hypothetical protein